MPSSSSTPPHARLAVVGTGFAGVGLAARLLVDGVEDLVVFERSDEVGGVWRDNVYPGAACDVHSHLYEFSFAPNPGWSRRFSPQPEIRDYLRRVAEQFGVTERVRFRHEVTAARWDDAAARWHIETSQGAWTADVLVAAPGSLAEPRLPPLRGLEQFEGVAMHTAQWDPDLDLSGRRVAVIGTGASAIQVVPAIQPQVAHLTLFQRTAPWVMPRRDRAVGEAARRRLQRWPWLHRLVHGALYRYRETFGLAFRHPLIARAVEAVTRLHLRRQVRDPDLRRVLTPDYLFGCKRVLLSDDYYPALTQPNVTVVDGAASEVRPRGVVGPDGREHAADVIVFATGFYVTEIPFGRRVVGREGRRLSDVWGTSPAAHLGTTVAGFPNFFLLSGPNTGLGHSSVLLMVEAQTEHIVAALGAMEARGLAAIEPTAEAQAAFLAEVDRRAEGTVWTAGGCASWYLDDAGRNAALWPGSVASFRRRVEPFRLAEYHLRAAAAESANPEPANSSPTGAEPVDA